MKKPSLLLVILVLHTSAFGLAKIEGDTLLKVKRLFILELPNVSFLSPYMVGGDLYLTSDRFIFTPGPYFSKRISASYSLIRDVNLSYDSIVEIKRKFYLIPYMRLIVKTKQAKYRFSYFTGRRRTIKKAMNRIIVTVKDQKKCA